MQSIVIDCDPGCDDAVAILFALKHANLKAITTVCGNVPLEHTTANALMIAALAQADVPVYAGANEPLEVAGLANQGVHGDDGLGGVARFSHNRQCESLPASEFLLNHVTNEDWVVATGPLTNLGEALKQDPDWGKRIGGISIMGGSTTIGNVTPVAEFNSHFDPHAAEMVYQSGAKLKMCGLNLTHQLQITNDSVRTVTRLNTPLGKFIAALWTYSLTQMELSVGRRLAPLHDPCAVLAVTYPKLFEFEELAVRVETQEGLTRGMTVIDQRTTRPRLPPNALVAQTIESERALQLLIRSLGG